MSMEMKMYRKKVESLKENRSLLLTKVMRFHLLIHSGRKVGFLRCRQDQQALTGSQKTKKEKRLTRAKIRRESKSDSKID